MKRREFLKGLVIAVAITTVVPVAIAQVVERDVCPIFNNNGERIPFESVGEGIYYIGHTGIHIMEWVDFNHVFKKTGIDSSPQFQHINK